jgi:hypothetical protein
VGTALALSASAPLWLGPAAERLGKRAVDATVAASPLSYVAVMAEYDYLRSRWLYGRSPLGSLRFDPPRPWVASGAYLSIAGALLVGERSLPKRRR